MSIDRLFNGKHQLAIAAKEQYEEEKLRIDEIINQLDNVRSDCLPFYSEEVDELIKHIKQLRLFVDDVMEDLVS